MQLYEDLNEISFLGYFIDQALSLDGKMAFLAMGGEDLYFWFHIL